jgi:membrane protease YdiL (CAAX protease family)
VRVLVGKCGNRWSARGVQTQMNRRPDLHELGFIALVILWGLTGHFLIANKPAAQLEEIGRFRIYLAAIFSLWLLFAYVAAGLRRRGQSVRSLIDPRPWTARRLGVYALIAIGMFFAWGLLGGILGLFMRPDKAQIQSLLVLFPRGTNEKALWAVMSLSAAFCEEFVYRGYLQTTVRRLSGSISVAVVLQALAYGFAHAALPLKLMVTVTFLGIFFGAVAASRKTLLPGMLMHAAFDLLAVFARK